MGLRKNPRRWVGSVAGTTDWYTCGLPGWNATRLLAPTWFTYDMAMNATRIVLACTVILLVGGKGLGKERHLDQVRTLLVVREARCTSCHETQSGEELNAYGRRLARRPAGMRWAERILQLERSDSRQDSGGEKREAQANRPSTPDGDVDGDGVANWVEILAHTNPANKKDTPEAALAARITSAVSCRMCHTASKQQGVGLEANPHNEFGALLARTIETKGSKRPTDPEAIRQQAEALPILRRLSLTKVKRPPKSAASYWQRIRLYRSTTDPSDAPTREAVQELKKEIARRKRGGRSSRPTGFEHPAHPEDGFLKDGKGLD